MNKNNLFFTLGEFAKLHEVNKRTLHYYDEIGLFSPDHKGDNGYRYYTYGKSMELITILAFREIGMSISEIQSHLKYPTTEAFISLSNMKIIEIEKTIKRLTVLKKMFKKKKEQLILSQKVFDGEIIIVDLLESNLFMTDLPAEFENMDDIKDIPTLLEHLKASWNLSSYKIACGSFISIEKVKDGNFESYDGLFTEIDTCKRHLYKRQKGKYLRGYSIGDWDKLPSLYQKMLRFAKENNLALGEFAFERGINECSISNRSEYITEVTIFCENPISPM